MKVIGDAVNGGEGCIGDGDALGIVAVIEAAANGEAAIGSLVATGLRPPPTRRTRSPSTTPSSRSCNPRPIVLRAIPVIRATAANPPQPAARTSLAASRRR